MNTQAVRTRRRDIVLIVMMCEIDVVHDILLATSGHAVVRNDWMSCDSDQVRIQSIKV